MVGHIKANFKSGGQMLSVSTTSLEGRASLKSAFDGDVGEFEGAMNALVYGIPAGDLKAAIKEAAEETGAFSKLVLKVEGGCDDPDCGDPDCADHGPRPLVPS
ncbi:MAG: hypothetical protein GX224_06025 [Thermoplasmatales archaeon]|nr:hypothetical protein [Thermoplasmatales archaeon]